MNKESKQIPKLTNKQRTTIEVVKKEFIFFNKNIIIFILFVLFFSFFLLNCKSGGLFKNIDTDPVPYSILSV